MNRKSVVDYSKIKCRGCGTKFFAANPTAASAELCCTPACLEKAGPWTPVHGPEKPSNKWLKRQALGPPTHTKKRKKKKRERIRHKDDPFFKDRRWLELRYEVLSTFGRQCMKCGCTDGEMHVDHVRPRSKFPHLTYEFSNLQVLCRDCNVGKSNKFTDDYRPNSATPHISTAAKALLCDCCKDKFPDTRTEQPKEAKKSKDKKPSARETFVDTLIGAVVAD